MVKNEHRREREKGREKHHWCHFITSLMTIDSLVPVMTSNHIGFSLCDAQSFDFTKSLEPWGQVSPLTLKLFEYFGSSGGLEPSAGIWISIKHRRSFTAWTASEAWRPCKSSFQIPLFSFRRHKISLAAFALRPCAALHSSRAFKENFWAVTWSPLKNELVAALEWWAAALLTEIWIRWIKAILVIG